MRVLGVCSVMFQQTEASVTKGALKATQNDLIIPKPNSCSATVISAFSALNEQYEPFLIDVFKKGL